MSDVSRETEMKLRHLLSEVRRWNPRINLVSARSLEDGWNRHIMDSVQIFRAWNGQGSHWVDLGSGGGFPGLVVAVIATENASGLRVTLVDADQRKCTFLEHAAREVDTTVNVICARAGALAPLEADVVSARALAPLHRLLTLVVPHLAASAVAYLHKGTRYQSEIATARRSWKFDCDVLPSETEIGAAILCLRNVAHA